MWKVQRIKCHCFLYLVYVYYFYHNVYIQDINCIYNMKNITSIGISRETLEELYSAKFDFRVNTMEETIKELLKEHEKEKEVHA